MDGREFSLVAFTILTQMSVGAFLVLGIVHNYAARKAGMEQADRLSDRAFIVIILTLGLGLLASLFHLSSPFRAPTAVTNFATSWLSREIAFGALFFVLGAIFVFMQWRKISSFAVRNALAWIAALVGLIVVYCMSFIYMLITQPAWNTLATPIAFFATTFLLGALAVGVAFVANYAYMKRKEPQCADTQCSLMRGALRWIAIASVIVLGIELVVLPIYLASLSTGPSAAMKSAQMMVGAYGWVLVLRVVLAFVGAGIFAMFLYQNAVSAGKEKMMGTLVIAAFCFVFVAEVLGRFLFYATQVGIGI
ncbi:MAG: dimethyl sulfoxide reductase anchor subunit [Anaerolineales bacterium]|nr:dimethyl sulfoxide reductase anchor subunit [Anaerolineales bacterium]